MSQTERRVPPNSVDREAFRDMCRKFAEREIKPRWQQADREEGRAFDAVHEGVIVGQPEMQDDRPHRWMHEVARRLAIRKSAHRCHPLREFRGRWRCVIDIAEIIAQGDRNTAQLNACIDSYNKVMGIINGNK